MRKGIDGLCGIISEDLGHNPRKPNGRRRGELLRRTVRIHGEGVSRGTDAEGKASEPGRSSRYANICKGRLAHL